MASKKFCFGQLQKNVESGWEEGASPLDLAKPDALRSIAEECSTNDAGKWRVEFEYVAFGEADETTEGGCWEFAGGACGVDRGGGGMQFVGSDGSTGGAKTKCSWNKIRDLEHGGRALSWFAAHPAAVAAKLTMPEVAMLRLYTGPLYSALNGALRAQDDGHRLLSQWWTCITILVCATFKLSFVPWYPAGSTRCHGCVASGYRTTSGLTSCPRCVKASGTVLAGAEILHLRVYRGINTKGFGCLSRSDEANSLSPQSLDFVNDGGVELAFCSTTTVREVAGEFANGGVVMELELSSTTRGAGVTWLSQYPGEAEWLLPPSTMLHAALSPGDKVSVLCQGNRRKGKIQKAISAGCMHEVIFDTGQAELVEKINIKKLPSSHLGFVATVRVPFQQLNMRVDDLESAPCLPCASAEPGGGFEGDQAECGSASELENLLQTERVSAGILSLEHGFFGGCGNSAIFLMVILGTIFAPWIPSHTSKISSTWESETRESGPIVPCLWALCVILFMVTNYWRAHILLRLKYQELFRWPASVRSAFCSDGVRAQQAADRARSLASKVEKAVELVEFSLNSNTDDMEEPRGPDAVCTEQQNLWERQRRAVDSLPLYFRAIAVIVALLGFICAGSGTFMATKGWHTLMMAQYGTSGLFFITARVLRSIGLDVASHRPRGQTTASSDHVFGFLFNGFRFNNCHFVRPRLAFYVAFQ
jgi:hypothetical protein